jgi:hypothetical protein
VVNQRIIAGVEAFQRTNPPRWFFDNLIRDHSLPQYKSVGRQVMQSAIGWWLATYRRLEQPLVVHAIEREDGAVKWWTDFLKRGPDYKGESIQSRGMTFPAVGWVIHPPPSRAGGGSEL